MNTERNAFGNRFRFDAFTLVELIVVITILAILATVGFLSLSGYTDDARSATVAANVRTVYSAILTESTTSGNSPRYYVDHDPAASLTGGAFAFVDGNSVTLTGGQWGSGGTNYSAGNPRWDRLRMNGDKFRLSAVFPGFAGSAGMGGLTHGAGAAYDTGAISIGAFDCSGKATLTGKSKTVTYFQVVGVSPSTKKASVTGNYVAAGTGAVLGLVRDLGQGGLTDAILEGANVDPTIVTCKTIRNSTGTSTSGNFTIDPDGNGGSAPYSAYCDMATDGGGWTRVAAGAPQGMIASNAISVQGGVPATETLFKYVSGSATYGGTNWNWDGVLPQRICMKIGASWNYLSANGVTIPNGCDNVSSGWSRFGCATSSAPQFASSLRTGSTAGRTCVGNAGSIAGSCFDYVIAPRAVDASLNALGDCEYLIPWTGHTDNSGTIYYDLFVR